MGYSYLCKKCGNIKFNALEKYNKCPYCDGAIEKISLSLNEIGTMSNLEKDKLRLDFQPKEKYDSYAWEQRIIKDNQLHAEIQKQTNEFKATHPECPYCHSRNTKKITTISKAAHTTLFGIFSMGRNSKNYHCNNCRSDF